MNISNRFYPSISSISTHFVKYRATASGIAIAGSSLGASVISLDVIIQIQLMGFNRWSYISDSP